MARSALNLAPEAAVVEAARRGVERRIGAVDVIGGDRVFDADNTWSDVKTHVMEVQEVETSPVKTIAEYAPEIHMVTLFDEHKTGAPRRDRIDSMITL